MNKVCSEKLDFSSLCSVGAHANTASQNQTMSNKSIAEAYQIHEFLKEIPIYHEVLSFQSQQTDCIEDSDNGMNGFPSLTYGSPSARSRSGNAASFEQMYKSDAEKMKASWIKNQSTVHTLSQNSYSDNSYHAEDNLQNEMEAVMNRSAEGYAPVYPSALKLEGSFNQPASAGLFAPSMQVRPFYSYPTGITDSCELLQLLGHLLK